MTNAYSPPVTAHAVLRYLKRVEKFDLRPVVQKLGREATNWPLARAAAAKFGVDVLEIQKRICPEHLANAVRSGAARIRREGMVLICNGGLVVSLYVDDRHRSVRMQSRREMRRGLQRMDRRRG